MTPKLIRELARRLRLSWNIPVHRKNTEILAVAAELERIAAEPVGGEDLALDLAISAQDNAIRKQLAALALLERIFYYGYRGPMCDPSQRVTQAEVKAALLQTPRQPDSAEGDWQERLANALSAMIHYANEYGPGANGAVLQVLRDYNLHATDEGKGEAFRPRPMNVRIDTDAEQPKAEGGFTRCGCDCPNGLKHIDIMHDDTCAALSAAPQPEPVVMDGCKVWQAVGDLLAVIHGDGGHYQNIYGTIKACQDAEAKYLSKLTQPEQPARDGVQELAKRIPRLRLQRVEDGGYVGFELLADPEGPLCRFLDVRNSAFYADLIRGQPPQQADAEMQPAQCPQCLYAFAMPATTKQADGGAVLWVSQGSFDWIKEIGGSGYILAFGHPFDDGKHIPLYAARPSKSPGVGVDEAMVTRALDAQPFADVNIATRVWQTIGHPDTPKIMRAALLAALGGEK